MLGAISPALGNSERSIPFTLRVLRGYDVLRQDDILAPHAAERAPGATLGQKMEWTFAKVGGMIYVERRR